MYGYIYETTNLINGKKYIGQKKSNIFLGNKYHGSGKILKQAILKYGEDNFSTILLYECNNQNELNKLEVETIKKYKELYKDNCYNISTQSGTWNMPKDFKVWNKGKKLSDEHKRKVSESTRKAMKNPETVKRIKLRNDKYLYGNTHALGKRTDKQRENISNATKKAMSKIKWCYVHNKSKNVRIKEDNLQHYLDLGYIEGKR